MCRRERVGGFGGPARKACTGRGERAKGPDMNGAEYVSELINYILSNRGSLSGTSR